MNTDYWHCPMCGNSLYYTDEENKAKGKREKNCQVICQNDDCDMEGAPLTIHHPINGVDADPGDSWSVSWVK